MSANLTRRAAYMQTIRNNLGGSSGRILPRSRAVRGGFATAHTGHTHRMGDYLLQVNYHEGDEPVLIPLSGYGPDEAETAHQALETEIEHAKTMHAPVVYSRSTVEEPTAGVPIDPSRVTGINLIAAEN